VAVGGARTDLGQRGSWGAWSERGKMGGWGPRSDRGQRGGLTAAVNRGQRQGGLAVFPRTRRCGDGRAQDGQEDAHGRFFREGRLEGGHRLGIPERPSPERAGRSSPRRPPATASAQERTWGGRRRASRAPQARTSAGAPQSRSVGRPPLRRRGARRRRWSRATRRRVAPRAPPRSPTAEVITLSMYILKGLCLTLITEE